MKVEHAAWLILGISIDADLSEATAAFALATRRIKSDPRAPFTVNDLTSALAIVESKAGRALRFAFAAPANPRAITMTPETARVICVDDSADVEARAEAYLALAMDCLRSWDWGSAHNNAKESLKLSQSETTRDEALNLAAAAFGMMGDSDKGVAALKQAVSGEWNIALQQNLGILAMDADPLLAADQASFWIEAATSQEDRTAAIFAALHMWNTAMDALEAETCQIPEKLRSSFRQELIGDIPEEVFAILGRFLADHDAEWTRQSRNWAHSPHAAGEVAGLVRARSVSIDEYMNQLIAVCASRNPQVTLEVDDFIAAANRAMMSSEEALGAALLIMRMLDNGLDCSTFNRLLCRLLVCREFVIHLAQRGDEPRLQVIDWIAEALDNMGSLPLQISGSEFLNEFGAEVGNQVGHCYLKGRFVEILAIEVKAAEIGRAMGGRSHRRFVDLNAVRHLSHAIVQWTYETGQIYLACSRVITDAELKAAWDDFMKRVNRLDSSVRPFA